MSSKKPTVEKAVKNDEVAVATEETAVKDSGFCMYIGPTIMGVIQGGSIYGGSRDSVIKSLDNIIKKYPLIESLVVTDKTIAEDRVKAKTPGNLLYKNYQKLASGRKS